MSETLTSSFKPTESVLPESLKGYAKRHGLREPGLFVSPVAHVFTCKAGCSSERLDDTLTALRRILDAIRESADLAGCPWPTIGIIDMSEQGHPQREEVRKKADDPLWHDGRVALYVVPFVASAVERQGSVPNAATEAPWHGPETLDGTRDALVHNAVSSASPPETPPMTMRDVVESLGANPELGRVYELLRDVADDGDEALRRFDSWTQPNRTEAPYRAYRTEPLP